MAARLGTTRLPPPTVLRSRGTPHHLPARPPARYRRGAPPNQKRKTEAVADSAQKAKIGQLADLSDTQEYEDLLARERSIIAGHTDVTFSGYVTVTAPTRRALDGAVATIARAAGQSCCELRPIYGHQMEAFVTAALPLARTTF
jgi:hypothetical protein